MEVTGKKFAILGLGKDGLSLIEALMAKKALVMGFGTPGSEAQKFEAEKRLAGLGVRLHWEPISESSLRKFDYVVFSSHSGQFHEARNFASRNGITVYSDLDLVTQFIDAPIIAITGTNGKTATLTMLKAMLEKAGLAVTATGGEFDEWGKRLGDTKKIDYHLFELSSMRLDNSREIKPKIAVLLNLFPAHEGRHRGGLLGYFSAKAKIFAKQGPDDFLIHEASAVNVRELIRLKQPQARRVMFCLDSAIDAPGVYQDKNQLVWLGIDGEREVFPLVKAANQSSTHLLNFMAALAAARLCGVSSGLIQSVLERFEGLPFRLQEIRSVSGIKFVNDARSTNLAATIWAISQFQSPVWLIMGGALSPEIKFSHFRRFVKKRVKAIFLIGADKAVLAEKLKKTAIVFAFDSLKEAVDAAYKEAEEKDVVLFSPGCAADIVVQGEGTERGVEFDQIVQKLPELARVRNQGSFTRI